MTIRVLLLFNLLSLLLPAAPVVAGHETDTIAKGLVIPYSEAMIAIDGALEDWETYSRYEFTDTNRWLVNPAGYPIDAVYHGLDSSNIRLPLSRNRATVFLCRNRQDLFIAVRVADGHLLGQWIGEGENPYIYLNDAVEVYIDAGNDSGERMDINDYQFIVDIHNQRAAFKGTLHAMALDSIAVPKEAGQNLLFQSAVRVSGTINGRYGSRNGYVAEIRIPFAVIGLEPSAGDTIRIDIGIEDADYPVTDLAHPKATFYNWAFDWAGYNDFGYPDVWKTAVLAGNPTWYSRVSGHYQQYWLPVLVIVLVLSGMTIGFLFFYSRRKNRLPVYDVKNAQNGSNPPGLLNGGHSFDHHVNGTIREAVGYIRAHIHEPIRSEDLASHLAVSLRTFQRITREEMDCTPTGLISIVRLNHAADYLRRKQGNVSEAAYASGFTDPGYFSRLFRQYYGVTPLDFLSAESDIQQPE